MKSRTASPVAELLGGIPNRLQLAGGWIDQPFVSRHNPRPPGSPVGGREKNLEGRFPFCRRYWRCNRTRSSAGSASTRCGWKSCRSEEDGRAERKSTRLNSSHL